MTDQIEDFTLSATGATFLESRVETVDYDSLMPSLQDGDANGIVKSVSEIQTKDPSLLIGCNKHFAPSSADKPRQLLVEKDTIQPLSTTLIDGIVPKTSTYKVGDISQAESHNFDVNKLLKQRDKYSMLDSLMVLKRSEQSISLDPRIYSKETTALHSPIVGKITADTMQMTDKKEINEKIVQKVLENNDLAVQHKKEEENENLGLRNEVKRLNEKANRLEKECDRLRSHLIQTEDRYTADALEAEKREESLRRKLSSVEDEMMSSSAAVLNARCDVTKQLDSLQLQLHLVTEQRDSTTQQLKAAEETISNYSSSLANLQMVLEQFQDERQHQQMVELEICRRDLDREQSINQQLTMNIDDMKLKMDELSTSVLLTRQLKIELSENKRKLIEFEEQVQVKETELSEIREKLQKFSLISEDKIDRPLVKNLLLGYIHTPLDKRIEAFQVICHILGFTEDELKEIGGTYSGRRFGGVLDKQSISADVKTTTNTTDHSFFELFIRFLENESNPRPPDAKLPTDVMVREMQKKQKRFSPTSALDPSLLTLFHSYPAQQQSLPLTLDPSFHCTIELQSSPSTLDPPPLLQTTTVQQSPPLTLDPTSPTNHSLQPHIIPAQHTTLSPQFEPGT